jgi:superoxide reductase
MAEKGRVYKCEVCGNIVGVFHQGGGTLVCCNQPMNLLEENSTDAAQEKHVPQVAKTDSGYKVTVGSVLHPMDDNHYIEWIDLTGDGQSYCKFLKPGEKPEATFAIDAESVTVRAYCNLHGYWKAQS